MDFFLEVTGIKLLDLPEIESHFPLPKLTESICEEEKSVRLVRADGSISPLVTNLSLDSIYFKFTGCNKVSEICFGTRMKGNYHYKGVELAKYSHTSTSVNVVKTKVYCNNAAHVDPATMRTFEDAKEFLKAANLTKVVGAGIIEQTSSEVLANVLRSRGFDFSSYCSQIESDSE